MTRSWKRLLAWMVVLFGAVLIQQTIVGWVSFGSIRPDLTLIALAAIALRYGPIAGLYAGMGLGLVQDVYAIETLGANSLAKCLVGYVLGFFEEKSVKSVPVTRVLLLGVAFLLHDIVFYVTAGYRGSVFWGALLRQTVPAAVYTLPLGAMVFYTVARFKPREA